MYSGPTVFHNYQTKRDIQKIIIDTMVILDKPVLEAEVAAWAWHRCLIDGIQCSVWKTVELEMRSMKTKQILKRVINRGKGEVGPFYEIYDPLIAMSLLTD